MKSGAYPASRMKPMYQARKKIVAGSTKRLRAAISSWNSGDAAIAFQSYCGSAAGMAPPSGSDGDDRHLPV